MEGFVKGGGEAGILEHVDHVFGVWWWAHLKRVSGSFLEMKERHTPPSGPNMPAPGSCAKPAYRAPVNPAKGLLPVPAAMLFGTPVAAGVEPVPACVEDD